MGKIYAVTFFTRLCTLSLHGILSVSSYSLQYCWNLSSFPLFRSVALVVRLLSGTARGAYMKVSASMCTHPAEQPARESQRLANVTQVSEWKTEWDLLEITWNAKLKRKINQWFNQFIYLLKMGNPKTQVHPWYIRQWNEKHWSSLRKCLHWILEISVLEALLIAPVRWRELQWVDFVKIDY